MTFKEYQKINDAYLHNMALSQKLNQQGEHYLFRKAIDERNLDLLVKVWNRVSPEEQKILLDNCSGDQKGVFMDMYNHSYGLSPNGEPDFDYDAHIEEINNRKGAEAQRKANNFEIWLGSDEDPELADFLTWAAKSENYSRAINNGYHPINEYDIFQQIQDNKKLENDLLDIYKKEVPTKKQIQPGDVLKAFTLYDTEPDSTPLSSNIIDAVDRSY